MWSSSSVTTGIDGLPSSTRCLMDVVPKGVVEAGDGRI